MYSVQRTKTVTISIICYSRLSADVAKVEDLANVLKDDGQLKWRE